MYLASPNLLKNKAALAISGAATETVMTDTFRISAANAKNLRIVINLSSSAQAKEVTGISFQLWHSIDGSVFTPVGSESVVNVLSATFADGDVDSGTEVITVTAHPFDVGDAVQYRCAGAGVVTGLTAGTVYYVIDASANTVKLATTRANAIAGTAINITAPIGGDAHYLTRVDPLHLIMNVENSSDQAQMPILPLAYLTYSSGTSDALTVSSVYLAQENGG